jgi:hypothetical protein
MSSCEGVKRREKRPECEMTCQLFAGEDLNRDSLSKRHQNISEHDLRRWR